MRTVTFAAIVVAILGSFAAYPVVRDPAADAARAATILAAVWFAAAQLLSIPYCIRFRGRPLDHALVGLGLGALFVLPLAPFGWARDARAARSMLDAALIWGPLFALWVRYILLSQGRHLLADVELPPLEGEARRAADEVLARTGLRPVAVLAGHTPTFNAGVQGLRACVVVVDRRAAAGFAPEELQAIIAHEAGHIRQGGILPYLAVLAVAVASAHAAIALRAGGDVVVLTLIGTFAVAGASFRQEIEFSADRFAARLVGPDPLARALAKVYADIPWALRRVLESPLAEPFISHPSIGARLAALGRGDVRALRRNRLARATAILLFLGVPWTVAAAGPLLPAGLARVPVASLVLLGCALAGLWIGALRAARSSFAIQQSTPLGAWYLIPIAAALLLAAVLLLRALPEVGCTLSVGLVAAAGVLVVIRARRGRRYGRAHEVGAKVWNALMAGRPEEAHRILEEVVARRGGNLWLLSVRGGVKLSIGAAAAAAGELREVVAREPRFPLALYFLAGAELVCGEKENARSRAAELVAAAPGDPRAWHLAGLVALDAGAFDEADRSFARACDLKGADALGLAGRALAALEARRFDGEGERWLADARAIEPEEPLVLLASARREQDRGRPDEARHLLEKAAEAHLRCGERGWAAYYRSLGLRWGIQPADGPPIAAPVPDANLGTARPDPGPASMVPGVGPVSTFG